MSERNAELSGWVAAVIRDIIRYDIEQFERMRDASEQWADSSQRPVNWTIRQTEGDMEMGFGPVYLTRAGLEAVIRRSQTAPVQEPEQDQDGYYDSSGEWWQDAHHYVPSDTDEVLKLIDETLK